MKRSVLRSLMVSALGGLLLVGCSAAVVKPDGADNVRNKLSRLQSDPELATRAPVAIQEAERAVRLAEQPERDAALGAHRVILADRKVEIARAQAQARLYQDQRASLSDARDRARLEARTREADGARSDVAAARQQAQSAQDAAAEARQTAAELRRELDELNARETDRGLVVTLGDLLFETGMANLRGGANAQLDKLARFLGEHPERNVLIEGHTDSVGSAAFNQGLSQRRADAVRAHLMSAGVEGSRLQATGMGLHSPIASNATVQGRAQNRRVELVISPAAPQR